MHLFALYLCLPTYPTVIFGLWCCLCSLAYPKNTRLANASVRAAELLFRRERKLISRNLSSIRPRIVDTRYAAPRTVLLNRRDGLFSSISCVINSKEVLFRTSCAFLYSHDRGKCESLGYFFLSSSRARARSRNREFFMRVAEYITVLSVRAQSESIPSDFGIAGTQVRVTLYKSAPSRNLATSALATIFLYKPSP